MSWWKKSLIASGVWTLSMMALAVALVSMIAANPMAPEIDEARTTKAGELFAMGLFGGLIIVWALGYFRLRNQTRT